jgi:phosphate starvation-inducible PhoH-like protein
MKKQRRQHQRSETVPLSQNTYSGSMDINQFYPKNHKQREFWNSMRDNVVSLAYGCAGTGKTLLALWAGLGMISSREVEKLVYVRSDVSMDWQKGRNGALKGSYQEKFAPLLGPITDNLQVIMKSRGAAEYLVSKGVIEVSFLEDLRGRSLNNSFVIVDEAQNITPEQVKTCLTRLGEDSRLVLIGDTAQSDHHVIRQNDGLSDAARRLIGIRDLGITQFGLNDIVRNPLIKEILSRYEQPSFPPHLSIAA